MSTPYVMSPFIEDRLWTSRAKLERHQARLRSLVMTASEDDILAEAERGEVVCMLYEGTGRPNAEGLAKDQLCRRLADEDKLRLWEQKGSQWSPYGMWSKWVKA